MAKIIVSIMIISTPPVALSFATVKHRPLRLGIPLDMTKGQNGDAITNGISGGVKVNGNMNGNGEEKIMNHFPPFPPEAFDLDVIADDAKSPMLYPELKVMDYLKSSRLLVERSYARRDPFTEDRLESQPTIQDLSSPKSNNLDGLWVSSWFRLFVFLTCWMLFPSLTQFLYANVDTDAISVDLTFNLSSFLPAVSLIYGTFISLTLSILYNRQKCITDQIGQETALLTIATQNIITIFEDDNHKAVEAGQCIANHVRLLVMESRGTELMTMMYSDPFVQLLKLLSDKRKKQLQEADTGNESLIDWTRDIFKDLFKIRAQRLGGESSSLPPTHFALMSILTGVLLLAFALSTIPTLSNEGIAPNETRFMFSTFTTVYVIFYTFAIDLNNPFKGVYQIRRSSPAAQLLQTKMLLMNNPVFKGKISFDKQKPKIR